MSQNLGKISLPPKFFLAGTPMFVKDCAYSDMVTLPYNNMSSILRVIICIFFLYFTFYYKFGNK